MSKFGNIIIISGPSGSGKTTLYQKLLASPKFKGKLVKSISVTTRPRRAGEVHGRDYIFVTREMFLYKRRRHHFLEWQKVFNNYYGTPQKSVQDLLRAGKNVLLCIDVKGAKVVCRKFPKALTIFIKTPSLAALKKRLLARGSEMKSVVDLRLATAREELKEAKHYKHIVVNNDLKTAFNKLNHIIINGIS